MGKHRRTRDPKLGWFRDKEARDSATAFRILTGDNRPADKEQIARVRERMAEGIDKRMADQWAAVTDAERAVAADLTEEDCRAWVESPRGPSHLTPQQVAAHAWCRIQAARWKIAKEIPDDAA